MATPEKPTLDYSYSGFQQSQGNNAFPGTELDNDLLGLKVSLDETIDFVSGVIRSDGALVNGVVTKEALASDILLGIAPPVAWETGVVYLVDETVTINNSLYICKIGHTAGVFAADLLAGDWLLIAEFTVPASIANDSVTTPKILNGAVTGPKLGLLAVGNGNVADGALTSSKFAASTALALVPVGAEMDFAGAFAPAGWLLEFGQAVGRVAYAALFAALCPVVLGNVASGSNTISGLSVDLRNLGLEGSPLEGVGVAGSAVVSSVTATSIVMSLNGTANGTAVAIRLLPWGRGDGSTTFNLPDARDRASLGRGNMGGVLAGRVSSVGVGAPTIDTSKLGGAGGVDRHTLTVGQLASHPHTATSAVSDPGHAHSFAAGAAATSFAPGPVAGANVAPSVTNAQATGIDVFTTVNPAGGGEAHPNVQPSRATNKIIFTGVV